MPSISQFMKKNHHSVAFWGSGTVAGKGAGMLLLHIHGLDVQRALETESKMCDQSYSQGLPVVSPDPTHQDLNSLIPLILFFVQNYFRYSSPFPY